MTVRVNKPPVNLREKLSELERPIGLKGSELMRAETVYEARDLISAGRKNLVINGSMEVAQRGTSGTKGGSSYGGYLCVDRWACYYDDTTMEQVDRTINGKLKKALKVTAAGSNGRPYVYHKIENSSKFLGDGTPFSISFWMRASASGKQQLQWRYYDNGTQNTAVNPNIEVINVSTEWKYYKIENVSIVDTSQNMTRDGGLWLYDILGEIGSGFWIEFTDVQIELGKQCTEFEHRSYGEELALCQRYFCSSFASDFTPQNGASSSSEPGYQINLVASGDPQIVVVFPTEMRAPPSAVLYNPRSGGTTGQWGTNTADSSNARSFGHTKRLMMIDNTDNSLSANYWRIAWSASAEL